jgi:hypothetical protein
MELPGVGKVEEQSLTAERQWSKETKMNDQSVKKTARAAVEFIFESRCH